MIKMCGVTDVFDFICGTCVVRSRVAGARCTDVAAED